MEDNHEGYIKNIHDVGTKGAFSFDLQEKETSKRFVCFSPKKRSTVQEKLSSPVKIKKAKLSTDNQRKPTDYKLSDDSEIVDTELDYQPIDYDSLKLNQLTMIPNGSLLNVNVTFISKMSSKMVKDKKIDVYLIGDDTKNCKLTIWQNCAGEVVLGKSYKLENVRVEKDVYGSYGLTTPKEGFQIEMLENKIPVKEEPLPKSSEKTIVGEVFFINMLSRYKVCNDEKCKRKLPAIPNPNTKSVVCSACNGTNVLKFTQDGMYLKFVVIDKSGNKTSLTMFKDVIDTVIKNCNKLTDGEIKDQLINLDEMTYVVKRGDIVKEIIPPVNE